MIWGNSVVHVTKDTEKKVWVVSTAKHPHQHIVTIPWIDAFKIFNHAPDYSEAISTCLSHETTALTRAEELAARAELDGPPPPAVVENVANEITQPKKIVSLDDYRRRKR